MATHIAVMSLCAAAASCSVDNLDIIRPEDTSEGICFGVSSREDDLTKSGGGKAGGYTSERLVLTSEDSDDSLCVRVVVTEGIDLSGEKVATRAAAVTTDSFYDNFHVVATYTSEDSFFMDEIATEDSSVWSTNNTYYWPGGTDLLYFYAWAPTSASFSSTPTSPDDLTLGYTVPSDVATQYDIVVSSAEEAGNYNSTVDLTFSHICTAVRFAVGSSMVAGTINSVALKGVYSTGIYDMASGGWTLTDAQGGTDSPSTADFSQTLDKTVTENESDGEEITTDAQTFMTLPQTLPDGATVEVSFTPSGESESKTLSASIASSTWTMGTTVTYKLSITPDYNLTFGEIPVVDAHYCIVPITVTAEDIDESDSWTITSGNSAVTFRSSLTPLEEDGYWLDASDSDYSSYCSSEGLSTAERTTSLTFTGNGEKTAYLFFEENSGDDDRTVTLTLSKDGTAVRTTKITQKCPYWQDGVSFGVERIQDEDNIWGFYWGSGDDMSVTYQVSYSLGRPSICLIYAALSDGVTTTASTNLFQNLNGFSVTIDYSELTLSDDTATSDDDGQSNTWSIYDYEGLSSISNLTSLLDSWGATASGSIETTPTSYAALDCAKKNKFSLEKESSGTTSTYIPTLNDQSDLKWYLPAKDEATSVKDDYTALSGDYWTSTVYSANDGQYAYKYTVSGESITTGSESRTSELHVRAVRVKDSD